MASVKKELRKGPGLRIVLVEPQTDGNIGAVCRAMKTMDVRELAVVGCREYDEDRIRTLALHAGDVWTNALHFPDLRSALSGCALSAGITRRRGKFRKYFSLLPEEFAKKTGTIGSGTVAAVFGREADGLTDQELALCNLAVHIPSSPAFPSLNLSHAVQIICYELFRQRHPPTISFTPVGSEEIDHVADTIVNSFDEIGFFKLDEKEEVRRFYTDILSRASLSAKEAKRVEKMFRKMAGIKIHKPGR